MQAPPSIAFIFLTLFVSCDEYSRDKNPIRAVASNEQEKKETFNYTMRKSACNKLYENLKNTPDSQRKKQFINFIADSLIPCWYGTKWNFYGTTEIPQQGAIACGYFVTTVIRDAGIPIRRIKLAQCASEEIIKSVCLNQSIKRYRNTEFETFISDVNKAGFGLYVIGLDNHTGFIFNDGKKAWFIHASYITPACVMKEEVGGSIILKNSKYKVIGRLRI